MMRTYARKRTEFKELENVTEICRLCLEKPDESVPIYSDITKLYSSLALRIMVCVGLEISNEENMPNIICTQCHEDVQTFYSFRKKCARSYQKLKSHIQLMKLREHKERQNSMFTINSDGSILLRDDNNSVMMTDNEPLVTLTKMLYDGDKGANSEVLLKAENNVANVDNSIVSNELVIKMQDQQTLPNKPVAVLSAVSKEHIVPEAKLPPDPELSDFLSTMLTELGVLTRHGDGVLDLGPKTSRTMELETRDGNNITFELVEEGDELENGSEECPVEENNVNSKEVEFINMLSTETVAGWRSSTECTHCGKMLANRGVLARHVRNVHKRARPHVCPTCGKSFAQKEVLGRHLLVHLEKRPFQCEKCPKSFTQRAALQIHSRLHAAPQERSLTLHQCPHCPKMFLYASGLSRHLLSHSNTTFPCAECGRRFFDKSSLKRHERTLHHDGSDTNGDKEDATSEDDPLALCTSDEMPAPTPSAAGS